VEVDAAGINYADTHLADGSYLLSPPLPYVPGGEVVGRTADGRRVLALTAGGGYAQRAVAPAVAAVDVPAGVSDGDALAVLVQGLSGWHLLRTCARLAPGETVVVNAAAGGVGSLAVQLAKIFGAGRVIGTASSAEKRELALKLGADAAVDGAADGYAERVLAAGGGRKVDVVLDAVGGRVLAAALDTLAPLGRLVTYGAASREAGAPLDPVRLMRRNLAVVGFWLTPLVSLPGHYREPLAELLALLVDGRLRPVIGGEYPLAEARRAHEDLLARRSTGKLVLLTR
jgi:NADPH2:quinone reductase